VQRYLRRRLAQREVRLKMGERAMVVRIQRFVKRWCRKKRQMTVIIQARLRQVRAKRKVARYLRITRGSSKLLEVDNHLKVKKAFLSILQNSKAVLIQTYLRTKLAKNKV
jgi:hypothetical protein